MCRKYLRTDRIAQTPKIMKGKNEDLYGFYESGYRYVHSWFGLGTPNKEFLKKWLGELIYDIFW